MSAPFGFTEADGEVLMMLAYDRESGPIVEWMQAHIRTVRDMHALMEFICRMVYVVFPMELTKGVELAEDEIWALRVDEQSDDETADAARMVTVALNADWDTLTALIKATLSQPVEHHSGVVAVLFRAWSDGLHAIAERNAS